MMPRPSGEYARAAMHLPHGRPSSSSFIRETIQRAEAAAGILPRAALPTMQRFSLDLEPSLPFGISRPPFPWATPAVDAMICALDAREVAIPEIARRVKKKFPTLATVALPLYIVERRLLILDQRIEVDYFKRGIGYNNTPIHTGAGSSRAVKHGVAIHTQHGELWEDKRLDMTPTKSSSLNSLHLTDHTSARGAKLGLAIHKGHGEVWELIESGKPFGDDTTLVSIPMSDLVPAPLTPARDDWSRPQAVEKSLRKMRSFNEETKPSVKAIPLSPFPTIPQYVKPYRGTEPPDESLPLKQVSSNDANKPGRRLLKKRSRQQLKGPYIQITKPSPERLARGKENMIAV